jgi:CheY-like chemotaxis protein
MKEVRSSPSPPAVVLLIDDSKDGNRARKMILQDQGYRIETSSDPDDALSLLTKKRIDLAVTEYRVKGRCCKEFIEQLRGAQEGLKVVLLSGLVETLGLDERSTGADAVVAKGAHEVTRLQRTISRLTSRRNLKRPPASQTRMVRAQSV